ncbi:MAG TPA: glycosyltransferase [Gemmatimonadales bacterium]|nr:glycosyltransferase [Gemmatimonadales bacterium]
MHVLWIKTELLHPVDKGGRIRTYHMLRALKQRHRVTYLTLDDGQAARDAVERAAEYSDALVRVPHRTAAKRTVRFYGELVANLFSRLPYAVAKYRSPRLTDELRRLVRDEKVDVVICDFLAPSLNVPDDLGVPAVLFQHNVEAMIWQRHAEVRKKSLAHAYFAEQWRRMVRFEREECRRFDRVIAVSVQDSEVIRREYGVADAMDVPTGVDTDYFRPSGQVAAEPLDMVFTGSMDWLPNEDGIRWFVDEVLPLIRAAEPGATLTVVGRYPPAAIRDLAGRDASVRVTGTVPDVRPYVERAALFVVPLRIGGGTRLKIFEAMAMERPVVSTTIGAEGLPVANGKDIVLADAASDFAAAVVRLLRNPAERRAVGQQAAAKVRADHAWDRVADRFMELAAPAVAPVEPGLSPAGRE